MSKRKAAAATPRVNGEICEMLNELANYEKNVNKNVYKFNAYRKAASSIARHPTKVTSGKQAKELEGVGDKISKKIDELLSTGKLQKLEKIQTDDKSVAINLMTTVPGIGPVFAHKLVEQGITTIEELRNHADQLNKYQTVGLKYFDDLQERIPREEMVELEKAVLSVISDLSDDYTATVCGSYRRGAATSGDMDILLTHKQHTNDNKKNGQKLLDDVINALKDEGLIHDEFVHGEMKYSGIIKLEEYDRYRQIDLRLLPLDDYWCGVLYFTGSDEFNRNMRTEALEQGYTINEYCIRRLGKTGAAGEPLPVQSEQDVFDYIGMSYKEPKDRSM